MRKFYFVFQPDETDADGELLNLEHYEQFEDLEDAVECSHGREVFEGTLKSLGYPKVEKKITFTKGKRK